MLMKLAFKNVKKHVKDFTIYFITLTFAVSIFYMFNSIYAQQKIMIITQTLIDSMIALRQILSAISIFVAVILGFLMIYANNFFIRRRKKELGMYVLLGMKKSDVSMILIFETFFIALCALTIGLLLGIFGSQFMSLFTAELFEANLRAYTFIFSMDAVLKSIFYFGIIFIVIILFNIRSIKKVQLIELFQSHKKNENLHIKNEKISYITCIISILCFVMAYILILKNGILNINVTFLTSIVLGCIGTFLFYYSLSGISLHFLKRQKQIYYRGLHMFTIRQLHSKINTNFTTISFVCLLLFLVIGIFSSGYSLQNSLSNLLIETTPFDFTYAQYVDWFPNQGIYESLSDELKDPSLYQSHYELTSYVLEDPNNLYGYFLPSHSSNQDISSEYLEFISYTDYCNIQKIKNEDIFPLQKNQYLILNSMHQLAPITSEFIEQNIFIPLNGEKLFPASEVKPSNINNEQSLSIVYVVDDAYISYLKPHKRYLNIQCVDEQQVATYQDALDEYIKSTDPYQFFVLSKKDSYESSITMKVLVAFLGIYLGFVFMISCAAVLAIQQLSETSDNLHRYLLLKKLGVRQKELNKALFQQILCYFLLPFTLAILHSIIGLTVVNSTILTIGKVDITTCLLFTSLFVVGIYGIYFFITYFSCRKMITTNL